MNTSVSGPSVQSLREAFTRVYDPEFGVSVEDLGLIYDIQIVSGRAAISMTLTSMYCPAGDIIMAGVKAAAETVPGISEATVSLVWDPQWTPDFLSARAREHLGWGPPDDGGTRV